MNQDEINRLFKFDFLRRTTLAAENNSRNRTNTLLELIVGSKGIKDLIRDGYYNEATAKIGQVVEQVLTQLGNLDSDIREAAQITDSYSFNKWARLTVKEKIDFLDRLKIYDSLVLKKLDDLRLNRNENAHFDKRDIKKSEKVQRDNAIKSVKDLHDVLLYFHKMYEKSNSRDAFFDTNLDNIYIPTKTNQKLHRNDNYSNHKNSSSSYSSAPRVHSNNYDSKHRPAPSHSMDSNSNYNDRPSHNVGSSSNSAHNSSSNNTESNNSSNYDSSSSSTPHNTESGNNSSYSSYSKPNTLSNNYENNFAKNVEQQGQQPVSYWTKGIKIWGTIILVVLILIPALNSYLNKYNASVENSTSETNTDNSDQSSSHHKKKADPDLKWKKQFAGQVFRLSVIARSPDNFRLGNEDADFNDIKHFVPNLMNRPKRSDEYGNTYVVFDSNVKSNKVIVTDQMSTATDAYRHPSAFNKLFAEQSRTGKNYYSIKNDGLTLDISKIKIYQYDEIGGYPTLFLSSAGMQKVDDSFKNVFNNEDIHEFLQEGQVDFYDQQDAKEITLTGNDFEKYVKNQPLTVKYKFEIMFELMDMDDNDY